jgi:hypothetical protein
MSGLVRELMNFIYENVLMLTRVPSVSLSDNGWTDDELTFLWFKEVFVPEAQARNGDGRPILLLVDGHGSHTTDRMREHGYQQTPRVHLLCLPSHTTHRLQPLDVGIFNLAQRMWHTLCDLRAEEGEEVTCDTVIEEWLDLRNEFMDEEIIQSAWRRTGHAPLNPDIFTDSDFAPSKSFSTELHLPEGYPPQEQTDVLVGDAVCVHISFLEPY